MRAGPGLFASGRADEVEEEILKKYPFTFDPKQKGLRKILGELEAGIMCLVWSRGEMTVREVHRALARSRDIAYTTVMTVMARLAEKKLLRRTRQGKAFVYQPAVSREEFTGRIVDRVIEGLMADFAVPAMSRFLDSVEEADPEKLEELARLIERKRKENE